MISNILLQYSFPLINNYCLIPLLTRASLSSTVTFFYIHSHGYNRYTYPSFLDLYFPQSLFRSFETIPNAPNKTDIIVTSCSINFSALL